MTPGGDSASTESFAVSFGALLSARSHASTCMYARKGMTYYFNCNFMASLVFAIHCLSCSNYFI